MILKANEENINKVGKILSRGGVAAIPTETVYGLAANALDSEAVAKIFKAKGRPADNPLIVHIATPEDMSKFAYPNAKAFELAKKFMPGPLTVILPKKDIIPSIVSAGLDTVAIRCPAHPLANAVIRAAGVPLAAPSANISGKPSATTAQHVEDDFGDNIDAVLDGGSCECGVESTVVTVATEPPVLLRPGFITPAQLRQVLPDLVVADAVLHELPKDAKVLSPGLKHKHYAPYAETLAVTGSAQNAAAFINKNIDAAKKTMIICFDGEEDLFDGKVLIIKPYGKKEDKEKQAALIFALLREADTKNIENIFIRCDLTDDIGLAVYNRLLRACSFNVHNADEENR